MNDAEKKSKITKYLVKDMGWVSSDDWENAKKLRRQNKEDRSKNHETR